MTNWTGLIVYTVRPRAARKQGDLFGQLDPDWSSYPLACFARLEDAEEWQSVHAPGALVCSEGNPFKLGYVPWLRVVGSFGRVRGGSSNGETSI